jgi:hypothetical protein
MPVQLLSSEDVSNGTRFIGRERRHLFTGCGHSVEKDDCLRPPKHTELAIAVNSPNADVVRYRGLCNKCEYKKLQPQAIIEAVKRHVAESLLGYMEPRTDLEMKGKEKWTVRKLALTFQYKKKTKNNNEAAKFDVCTVAVYPGIPDGCSPKQSRQWETVILDIDRSDETYDLKTVDLGIQGKIDEYERKWNEFSQTKVVTSPPQEHHTLQQASQDAEDYSTFDTYLRYGDPSAVQTTESLAELSLGLGEYNM